MLHKIGGAIVEEEKLELRRLNQVNSSYRDGDDDDDDDYEFADLINFLYDIFVDHSSDDETATTSTLWAWWKTKPLSVLSTSRRSF
ncbi:unnamed protein product [Rodentolepis nana]|uniref:Ovule protein n=1 Tax=Rodentolepis nana TaxID=102285 RepID=A0A0R3TDL0_RODNA|nr:unnamed protein product [Rodentolepis nana]